MAKHRFSGVFLLFPITAIFLWILTLFSLKRIYYFYLYYLIGKIIYRFKNNIYCFWILKSCVKNTIFSLYFYFEFFVLYFCIYISISIFPFFFSIILVLYFFFFFPIVVQGILCLSGSTIKKIFFVCALPLFAQYLF